VDKDAFPKPGKYTIEVSITSGNVTKVKKYKVKLKESGELIIK
jgi:hypothetical protein